VTPIEEAIARRNREYQRTGYGLLLIAAVSLIIAAALVGAFT
jgi:hypothetical protein